MTRLLKGISFLCMLMAWGAGAASPADDYPGSRIKAVLEQRPLALDLSVNGLHAWNKLYDKMAADLEVDFVENGETKQMSLGQLHTKMAEPDRDLRRQAFEKLDEAWDSRASRIGWPRISFSPTSRNRSSSGLFLMT